MRRGSDTADDVVGVLSMESESALVVAVGVAVPQEDVTEECVERRGKRERLKGRNFGL